MRLNTLHNLHFFLNLMADARVAIEQDRYEADDLIATYACQAHERGADVLIVSADKDLMQLIRPGVSMFDPASGTQGSAGARDEPT
jgi:DNA polymerase-1